MSDRLLSPSPIRVLLADDHPIVRFGLQQALHNADDMLVVAESERRRASRRDVRRLLEDSSSRHRGGGEARARLPRRRQTADRARRVFARRHDVR